MVLSLGYAKKRAVATLVIAIEPIIRATYSRAARKVFDSERRWESTTAVARSPIAAA